MQFLDLIRDHARNGVEYLSSLTRKQRYELVIAYGDFECDAQYEGIVCCGRSAFQGRMQDLLKAVLAEDMLRAKMATDLMLSSMCEQAEEDINRHLQQAAEQLNMARLGDAMELNDDSEDQINRRAHDAREARALQLVFSGETR